MLTHRQKCLLCIGISRARAFCLPRFIFPGPGICVYFYERHQCVWKQTNHGIEERRKWGVRDCSFIVNHQRNKMAIPRKPAVCVCVVDRLLLVRKAREDSRLAYPQISCFFWPGSNIHFFFFFFCSSFDLSFGLFDCYACLTFMLFWGKQRGNARFYSLLLFSSLRCCVYICYGTKWCADCRSRGFGSYGFPSNLSLYRYIVETAGAIVGCY